jgi:hypothetical protein
MIGTTKSLFGADSNPRQFATYAVSPRLWPYSTDADYRVEFPSTDRAHVSRAHWIRHLGSKVTTCMPDMQAKSVASAINSISTNRNLCPEMIQMSSFQITLTPNKRAAGRFISRVRRAIQKALAEEEKKRGITQSDIARAIGINRSIISREIRGHKDMTLGRVAELAWALGRKPSFDLPEFVRPVGSNAPTQAPQISINTKVTGQGAVTVRTGQMVQGSGITSGKQM